MSSIKVVAKELPYPHKELIEILIKFYETMKRLESDAERNGKQAIKVVMTVVEIESLFKQENV